MTIYATPFSAGDMKTTGPSLESGFVSIDDVVAMMGTEYVTLTSRLVVYGSGDDRIVFSKDLIFQVDETGNNH